MKPFNLQEALAGKPVITRDGRSVKIAGYNTEANESECVVGWADGVCMSWYNNGNHMGIPGGNLDLLMAPEKREYWVGLFRKDDYVYCAVRTNVHDLNELALADMAEVLFIGKVYEEEY